MFADVLSEFSEIDLLEMDSCRYLSKFLAEKVEEIECLNYLWSGILFIFVKFIEFFNNLFSVLMILANIACNHLKAF